MKIIHAGIIAAGHGSRLSKKFPGTPKPLIPVAGRPMLHWITRGLKSAGIESAIILLNSRGDAVRRALEREPGGLRWTFLQADTQSSFDSFRLVAGVLAEKSAGFCVSTVDAIVPPADAALFLRRALRAGPGGRSPDAALALTGFVEDEKPLWADVDKNGAVTGLGERAARRDAVTCGLYALSARAAKALPGEGAYARLRDFWSDIIDKGGFVRGVRLADTVDVDRPEDIPAAEKVTRCFDA